ncbi:MAG: TonB-dependent receptor [Candidatus Eisenbacteria bacterium]|nr:TonB-dependent receptor [Candidatus Eisenbacteria bacterium]
MRSRSAIQMGPRFRSAREGSRWIRSPFRRVDRCMLTLLILAGLSLPLPSGLPLRLLGPATAAAQAAPDSTHLPPSARVRFWPIPIDTVQVRAPRPDRAERLARLSSFVTLLDVSAERGPAEDAAALLSRNVGLTIQRLGGPGSRSTISIRGADPGEVEVFLDRTPLRSAARGVVDLSALDLSQVAFLEIYRSAPPNDLGGAAAGAAVRLVTREGGARQTLLRASGGSYGTREFEAIASGRLQAHRYFFSASRFHTEGDYPYWSDNGTMHDAADDAWRTWSNGAIDRDALFGKLNLALPLGTELEWSSQISRSDEGVPGTGRRPTRRVRLRSRGQLHRAELSTDPRRDPLLRAHLYGFLERARHHYEDPERELAVTGTPGEVEQHLERQGLGLFLARGWMPGARAGTPHPWLGHHSFELLLERREESLRRSPPPERPQEDLRQRRGRVLSVGDNWDALGGRLHLSAFHRWERIASNYVGSDPYRPFVAQREQIARAAGPRLGGRLALGGGIQVKANYAHQTRFPTFTELFGYFGTMQGNPELRPETGKRWDVGWTWAPPAERPGQIALRSEHVYFESDLREMIVFIRVSDRETKPLNLDRARIRGHEFSLTLDHLPLLRQAALLPLLENAVRRLLGAPGAEPGTRDASLALHLTAQDARDRGVSPIYHGQQLTYHPPLQSHLRCDLRHDRWQLAYTLGHRDPIYWGRSNLPAFRTRAQWRHDLQLGCRLAGGRLRASLRIENLADAPLEDVRGYPLPGRCWFAGLEVRP